MKSDSHDVSRRRFLFTVAAGAAGAALLPSLTAFAADENWRFVGVPLESLDKIKDIGAGMALEADGTPLILIRTAADKIAAYSPICTHEKCAVAYVGAGKGFKCGCHESYFDDSGKPTSGPATLPLNRYATGIKEGKLVVRLPAK